jgi:2-oxoglutarate dehydrogenase E1 component
LKATYCGSIGVEYMYISTIAEKRWIQDRLERIHSKPNYTADEKKRMLERLTAAETLERYLHTRYVGQKRFSLEGGESLIVAMDELIRVAGAGGVDEIVVGMAHRGRLNVLVNTLGKAPAMLFDEFEGKKAQDLTAGDVKYHMGYSSDVSTPGGPCHLTLSFNPSHLEIVNPVVVGSVYSRQRRRGEDGKEKVLAVLIHGDAAVAGQGVNQEMLNFAQTRGYGTAARCISWSTTRSVSPPRTRATIVRRCTAPTSSRWPKRRSSTSMVTTRKRWRWSPALPSNTARPSRRMWWSTSSAIASSATTSRTSRWSRSR